MGSHRTAVPTCLRAPNEAGPVGASVSQNQTSSLSAVGKSGAPSSGDLGKRTVSVPPDQARLLRVTGASISRNLDSPST
jgi:hypothetical protein